MAPSIAPLPTVQPTELASGHPIAVNGSNHHAEEEIRQRATPSMAGFTAAPVQAEPVQPVAQPPAKPVTPPTAPAVQPEKFEPVQESVREPEPPVVVPEPAPVKRAPEPTPVSNPSASRDYLHKMMTENHCSF